VTQSLSGVAQWQSFLAQYSADCLRVMDDDELRDVTDEQRAAGWLGYEGADEERLVVLEQRLGVRLPASYRAFLGASDGWLNLGPFMWTMRRTDAIGWFRDVDPETWRIIRGVGDECDDTELMDRALLVSGDGDAQYWLLDPGDVSPDGEWAAYIWASWFPGLGERHASFAELVIAERASFEELKGRNGDGVRPEGADQLVAEGCARALQGEVEQALALFARAAVKGSGAGAYLEVILGAFLNMRQMHYAIAGGVLSHRHVIEAIGVEQVRAEAVALFLRQATYNQAPVGDILPKLPTSTGDERADWQARVARFVPPTLPEPPTFQRALDRARILARAGATDEAWTVIETALPDWHSDSPYRIAPVIVLTDHAFRDVITPDRARQIAMTPRGASAEAAI
jgi:hypothetical protein